MKIGAENRTKLIWALVLGAFAVIFAGRALFNNSNSPASANTSNSPAPTQVAKPRPSARRSSASGKTARVAAPTLDPMLQLDLLKQSEDTKYAGSGRNIFVAKAEEIPRPKAPANTDTAKVNTPPPPPPPPPILLKFFGFANKPGEPRKIFLSQGEDVFIAGEGDIVDRRYRILHIGPGSVEVEDVLNNNRQTIPLTQG